ncbi:CLCA_X family protein [Motiliproteus sp. SC1-56]|uniref:CLCA_X family protein n=1 Tax=Motiliproteus sp. SC1-56 TaxID=2799565 RepID=UPI001A8FBEFE|nr:CLCA_X family protein [Motiliproteus sp. SC1-56]
MPPPRQFYRRGPDTRRGQPVTFADVRRRFDFRSIRIGRWVTEAERDRASGLFYDALVDLMHILQGPEALISLRGSLSLKYGIGGQPGVAAHYQPGMRCFSLAKNAGPGSIAHEWFHALDHYLGNKAFSDTPTSMFASKAWLSDATPVVHPLNDRLFACFRAILLDAAGDNPSTLFRTAVDTDRRLRQRYFSQPEEVCARAFEAFVQDAGIRNNFLVAGTRASEEAKRGLYPQGDERARINAAFQDYFSRLGTALSRGQ